MSHFWEKQYTFWERKSKFENKVRTLENWGGPGLQEPIKEHLPLDCSYLKLRKKTAKLVQFIVNEGKLSNFFCMNLRNVS